MSAVTAHDLAATSVAVDSAAPSTPADRDHDQLSTPADRDRDLDPGSEHARAVSLARAWMAVGVPWVGGRAFITYVLAFATLMWGEFARGAFFRSDLIVFTALALAAAASVSGAWRILAGTPWLAWTSSAIVVAVVVSAVKNHQIGDLGYVVAPVVAAVSLGVVGVSVAGSVDRLLVKRIVVDVAVLTALLGTVGVAFHLNRFAKPQAEGWRASASLGYANATAVLLIVGALCACALAATSGAISDQLRLWVILLGLIGTQSRGVLLALAACWVILVLTRREMAWILARATAWALVAFVGLLPAIEHTAPQPAMAIIAAAAAGTLLVVTSRDMPPVLTRWLGIALGTAAAVIVVVLLNTRVADPGSNAGRLQLWHEAISHLGVTGIFGAGPAQIADFSNGRVTQLFDHNDLLQYVQYYGVFGAGALAVILWQLVMLFTRSRGTARRLDWSHGLTTAVALTLAALVDFPLQVPLLPAVTALVIGATVGGQRYITVPTIQNVPRYGKALP